MCNDINFDLEISVCFLHSSIIPMKNTLICLTFFPFHGFIMALQKIRGAAKIHTCIKMQEEEEEEEVEPVKLEKIKLKTRYGILDYEYEVKK